MSIEIPENVRKQRADLVERVAACFVENAAAQKPLVKTKPEGWEDEFYRLNDASMRQVADAMKGGMLGDFPNLFTDAEKLPKRPDELDGKEAPDQGDYRKIEIGRTDKFIIYAFRFGGKNEHPSKEGAETPLHCHLEGACAMTSYFFPESNSVAPLEQVWEGDDPERGAGIVHPATAREMLTVGGRNPHNYHVVFNPSLYYPAYTIHVYPLEEIREGRVVNYSKAKLPPTAVDIRAADGHINPTTHKRDRREKPGRPGVLEECGLSVIETAPPWRGSR